MTARVYVTMKKSVLDPQGQAVRRALNAHGHPSISEVRQGKYFEISLDSTDAETAKTEIDTIARDILSNAVIEDYRIEIL
jgi:phosphoribosylformylglycinamidine synthase PurS subunit